MSQLVQFDWAIKYLLQDKANFDILEGFISAVISEDIQVQKLLDYESNQADEKDDPDRVELLVKDTKGELFFIEIQIETELDFFQRMIYGTSKMVVQSMQKRKSYMEMKRVISISIDYRTMCEGQDYVYRASMNFIGINQKDDLKLTERQKKIYGKPDIYGLFPEYYLLRINEFDDHVCNDLDQWIYMLKHGEIEPDFNAKHIQEAGKRLQYMSLNKKERLQHDRYLENLRYRASMEDSFLIRVEESFQKGFQQGFEESIQEGIEQGKRDSTIAIARNLLIAGLSVSQIADSTGLSVDDIIQMQMEM